MKEKRPLKTYVAPEVELLECCLEGQLLAGSVEPNSLPASDEYEGGGDPYDYY